MNRNTDFVKTEKLLEIAEKRALPANMRKYMAVFKGQRPHNVEVRNKLVELNNESNGYIIATTCWLEEKRGKFMKPGSSNQTYIQSRLVSFTDCSLQLQL